MNQTIVQRISDNVKYNLHDFLTLLWLLSKQIYVPLSSDPYTILIMLL